MISNEHLLPSMYEEAEEWCKEFLRKKVFTPKTPGAESIGLEIELFPRRKSNSGEWKTVPLSGAADSLSAAMLRLLEGEARVIWSEYSATPEVYAFHMSGGDSFYFEPGGQLEFVSTPCASLIEVHEKLKWLASFEDHLLESAGIALFGWGSAHDFTCEQIGLQLDRPRYNAMKSYFEAGKGTGVSMMLQTCSIQVNIDFGANEEVMIKRLLASHLLSPICAALFANSPHVAGCDMRQEGCRTTVWCQVDGMRTAPWLLEMEHHACTKDALVEAYWRFAQEAPIVFFEREDGVHASPNTWREWLQGSIHQQRPNAADFERHLSLLFPMVRPKGFIEFRSMDALPVQWRLAPVLFYTTLLMNETALQQTLEVLWPKSDEWLHWQQSAEHGLSEARLASVAKQLMELALHHLKDWPESKLCDEQKKVLHDYYSTFTQHSITPATQRMYAGLHNIPIH
jgi:glutamate--cysteine ligase